MWKFWTKIGLLLVAGALVVMFFNLNKVIVQNYKMPKQRIFTDIQRVKEKNTSDDFTNAKIPNSYPCPEITMPTLNKETSSWQPVDKESTGFIFSAYFLHESKKIVIIGMIRQVRPVHFCQLWYKDERNQYIMTHQVQSKLTRLPEGHGQVYTVALFECPLDSNSGFSPSYISMVDKNCTAPLNILSVQHVNKPEAVNRNFTVCLPPLHGNPSIYRIVEWIEFNIILGADHLFVYNYTSNANLHKVLEFYSNKGFVTIIPWNLPVNEKEAEVSTPVSVHYFGQVAALNDCLYRNKYESEFIINIDLDEFIIPHAENETTWHQILSHANHNQAVYIIRNTFFKVEWDNANIEILNKSLVEKYKLITLQKLQHEKKIFSPGQRSKYFARTSRTYSLMIHTVPSVYNFRIEVDTALLHHYRDIETRNDPESSKVLDRTVPDKFGNDLLQKVITVWSELNETLTDNI